MKRESACCAVILVGALAGPVMAGGHTFIFDDDPYVSSGDSPFDLFGPGSDFFLENFEDGLLNTPGLLGFGGEIRFPSDWTDSVDADDGIIDGFGLDGHSYWAFFGEGGPLARFEFDPKVLGGLPRSVGLVWTDGNFDALTFFEAFGPKGESLGAIGPLILGDGGHQGATAEDRFLGVTFQGGISAIEISATLGRIELDHVQYGDIIPAPGVLALLGLSGLLSGRSRRRLA
ncbi:MAG: hypothetical protein IIA64_10125 [Planctomycetes bacterium]|nr:hypothetical protein [Planctomycetota bacterium]